MFNAIKRNLFKYFGQKNKNNIVEEIKLTEESKENNVTSTLIPFEVEIFKIEKDTVIDPKKKLEKSLKYLAVNNKKFRVRKKNSRRLKELLEVIEKR